MKPEIEHLALETLIPYARNSRTHSDEQVAQIAASIREFGFTNPVLIDGEGGIIAGHGRVLAARKLSLTEVPCIRLAHLSDAQKRAYVIADNKLALNSGWDIDMLKVELSDLVALGFDLDLTGFSAEEIDAMMSLEIATGLTDEDAVPEVRPDPVSKPGDVWLLGKHRVVCGDATSADDWGKLSIVRPAMVFSSPPYGVGENAKLRDKYVKGADQRKSLYATHTDSPDEWPQLMRDWTTLALAETDCVVCNVQSLANNKRNVVQWVSEFSGNLVDIVIWDKGHGAPQMQRNVLTNSFEWIYILSPEPDASRAIPLGDFHGTIENIVRISAKGGNEFADVHRATMPIELAQWGVESIGPKAKTIVDPFGGTGTTLIAAEKSGKRAALIELDPKYVDVIVRRWQEFTGKAATLEADGRTFAEVTAEHEKEPAAA
jgi:ParB-like chromosome segregation protein Spo0J